MIPTARLLRLLLALLTSICASAFMKSALVSRKLCNNDPMDVITTKCFNAHHDTEVACDTRRIPLSECNQLQVSVDALNLDVIRELSASVDGDKTVRGVTIEVSKRPANWSVDTIAAWGELVDSFLTPRPAWSVVLEPFNTTDPLRYTLERYSQLWDAHFEHVTSLNYPSPEMCSKLPMAVLRSALVHPGYSDVRRAYFQEYRDAPVVFGVFVTSIDKVKDYYLSSLVSDEDCPAEHVNKFTCAFLPTTNCTFPAEVATLRTEQHYLYSRADASGENLKVTRDFRGHALSKHNDLLTHIHTNLSHVNSKMTPHFVYLAPYTNFTHHHLHHGVNPNQVPDFLFMRYLFRQSAFYRRKVAESLSAFRAKYGLGDHIRTKDRKFVAIQLRRGDRTAPGMDYFEYCRKVMIEKTTGVRQNCTYAGGEVKLCPYSSHVLGCEAPDDVPIGSLSLDFAAKHAELLVPPEVRNAVVFTDDNDWARQEVARLEASGSEWRFFLLDPLPTTVPAFYDELNIHDKETALRYGTHVGVQFHASLALLQECEALVGHFGSGVPMTFTGAMCNRHAGLEGICPPVYNLQWGAHDN